MLCICYWKIYSFFSGIWNRSYLVAMVYLMLWRIWQAIVVKHPASLKVTFTLLRRPFDQQTKRCCWCFIVYSSRARQAPRAPAHKYINTLRPRPNRRQFADDTFKCIFENENEWILPRISLKFVPKVRINNISALVQIMAWRRPGDRPLSEPMMASILTHICVTRPQWGKLYIYFSESLGCLECEIDRKH